jgi:hypothetical protein
MVQALFELQFFVPESLLGKNRKSNNNSSWHSAGGIKKTEESIDAV